MLPATRARIMWRWRKGYLRTKIDKDLFMEWVSIGDRLFYGYLARTAWLGNSGRFNIRVKE